jgi:hypothetical protein
MKKQSEKFREALTSRFDNSGWSSEMAASVIKKRYLRQNKIKRFAFAGSAAAAAASIFLIFTFMAGNPHENEAVFEDFISKQVKGVHKEIKSEIASVSEKSSLKDSVFSDETDLLIEEALALR